MSNLYINGVLVEPKQLYSRETEESLIGWLMHYPDRLEEVRAVLESAADFHVQECRDAYNAILRLDLEGRAVDPITVAHEIGGADPETSYSLMRALQEATPNLRPIAGESYAAILRELAKRRKVDELADQLKQAAAREGASFEVTRASILDQLATDSSLTRIEDMPILADDEAEALPPLKGILGDILFDESVTYLYGPSGRWKSFVALDWAMSIATARPWMGRPTQGGDVLYVASEGARGLGKRITAWKQRHGVNGRTRLRIMPLAIDLTNAAQVAALPRRLDALDIHPRLIVFDTLAASNSGDENTAENAARITSAARRIIRAHEGASVLVIHHTGYDATHMRGSTAFFSNADSVIRIEGGEANRRIEPGEPITLISDKAKDGEPFKDIALTADLQTWADEQSVIHSSLVMIPADTLAADARLQAQMGRLPARQRDALAVLEQAGDAGLTRKEIGERIGCPTSTAHNVASQLVAKGLARQELNGLDTRYYRMAVTTIPKASKDFQWSEQAFQ